MMESEPSIKIKTLTSGKWLIASFLLVFIVSYGFTTIVVTISPIGSPLAEWEPLSVPDEYSGETDFREIDFINSTHGWLLGDYALLQTTDGGESWSVSLTTTGLRFLDLSVVTSLNIWISGSGPLRHTIDGGATWESIPTPGIAISKAEFYNTTHGIAGDSHGLFRTTDGGISWQNSFNWSSEYNNIEDTDMSEVAVRIATSDGFYLSEDWGETWVVQDSRGAHGLSFITEDEGWILHQYFISHQVNGTMFDFPRVAGLRVPPNSNYADIEFIDSEHGWVVGFGPAVMYTPDGGNSWYEQECPDYHFRSVDFINATHGWAAGSNSAVARTVTGDSLGPHLPSGVLFSLGFTNGGPFIPYLSIQVSSVSIMAYILLICILRRKIPKKRNVQYEGTQIQ